MSEIRCRECGKVLSDDEYRHNGNYCDYHVQKTSLISKNDEELEK